MVLLKYFQEWRLSWVKYHCGQNANSDITQTTFMSKGNYGCIPSTVKKICQRVDWTRSATECKAGCGRLKSARSEANIAAVIF